jgi:hypothetical protein
MMLPREVTIVHRMTLSIWAVQNDLFYEPSIYMYSIQFRWFSFFSNKDTIKIYWVICVNTLKNKHSITNEIQENAIHYVYVDKIVYKVNYISYTIWNVHLHLNLFRFFFLKKVLFLRAFKLDIVAKDYIVIYFHWFYNYH